MQVSLALVLDKIPQLRAVTTKATARMFSRMLKQHPTLRTRTIGQRSQTQIPTQERLEHALQITPLKPRIMDKGNKSKLVKEAVNITSTAMAIKLMFRKPKTKLL